MANLYSLDGILGAVHLLHNTLESRETPHPLYNIVTNWGGPPTQYCYKSGRPPPFPILRNIWTAPLVTNWRPLARDWDF